MKTRGILKRTLLIAALLASGSAFADALTLSDPIQLGRLSRNGIPQDWSGTEAYPGVINTTTPYHYRTYFYNVGLTPYIQISIDSISALTFFSAYQTFYNPTNLAQQWLGDPGGSGNYNFDNVPANEVDPRFFQVTAAANSTLVLVVNESTTNGGIGQPFNLLVEGFSDTEYDDETVLAAVPAASRIPEPSTMLLLAPLALVVGLKSRRRRAVAVAA